MSQIFAIFHLDGSPIQPKELELVAQSQASTTHTSSTPRMWRDTDAADDIGLVHLRQIITAEDHLEKPWTSEDSTSRNLRPAGSARSTGSNVITADARLDNREELARQFHISATQLPQLPDCALILAAYEYWGDRCTEFLLGDFAFIIWNRTRQQLFCARAAIGIRSLYWFKDKKRLVVASTTTTLFALPGINRELDSTALTEQLAFAGNPDRTLYQNVFRLPCAHTLTITKHDSKANIHRYWTPDLSPLLLPSDDQYLELFNEIFSDAVQCRLRTAGKVGIMMSGGLDSTSVAAIAAPFLNASGKRLTAFSSLPPDKLEIPDHAPASLQERPLLDAIAKQYPNIDLQTIQDQSIGPLDSIEQSFEYSGNASVATANRCWLEQGISQASKQNINVMLTGALGNATMSYDGHTRLTDLFRRGHWRSGLRELRAYAATSGTPSSRLMINHLLVPLLSPSAMAWLTRLGLSKRSSWRDYTPVSSAAISTLGLQPSYVASFWNRRSGSAEVRVANLFSAVIEDAFSDENSVRHRFGVDSRDPTADKRIVEFCLSLPEDQYLRNGQDRSLIRRAMKGKLPATVLNQTTRGAQAQDWSLKMAPLREEFRQELQRMKHSEAARQILDLPRLEALVEDWPVDNWFDSRVVTAYKNTLYHGIAAGRFIRWVERKET